MIRSSSPSFPRTRRADRIPTYSYGLIYNKLSTQGNVYRTWISVQFQRFKLPLLFVCLLALLLYVSSHSLSFDGNPQLSESHNSISFLVIGDWGANPQEQSIANQTSVARAMLSIHQRYSTRFVISVGDHFYPDGLLSKNDPRWISAFEQIYDTSLAPWYIAMGNHDVRGSVQAQIEYSELSQKLRWNAPSTYYAKDFQLPQSNDVFRIIFLDTNNLLCNHEEYDKLDELESYECDEMYYKHPEKIIEKFGNEISMERALEIQAYNFRIGRKEQLHWLQEQVVDAERNEQIQFVLMVGHHALFSQGPHKIPKLFNQRLQPILRSSNKIVAYFCGHNHALEHYIWDRQKHANDGDGRSYDVMHQFLSGSGGREVHAMKDPPVESQLDDVKLGYLGKLYGFISVHVDEMRINVKYWDKLANEVYSYSVEYRKDKQRRIA
eukprot:CAMPEP_0197032280 /NCGR_PEP_ID=MMETSP1384-20130603/10995_1 /TAXON_ID=29189 /ORGANISM="Ammonia sp." /LENGTH=436 /DNA_ID=CAMNT_0042461917 /DNA_START=24 /DNA_END=1334 /DNA_ORIENTATION=+